MKIGFIGAGSWGTALAFSVAKSGIDVLVWSRNPVVVKGINNEKKNLICFSEHKFADNVSAVNLLSDLKDCQIIFLAVPVMSIRDVLLKLKETKINKDVLFISCSKGIEQGSFYFVSQIFNSIFSNDFAILAGPNLASEVICSRPWFTTIAFADNIDDSKVQNYCNMLDYAFKGDSVYLEYSIGTPCLEIYGAIKNVAALIMGFARGLEAGENFAAGLFTLLIKECKLFANFILGSDSESDLDNVFHSYGGMGDMVLTCYTRKSRNMNFGFQFAQNISDTNMSYTLVEGLSTLRSINKFIEEKQISEMFPIIEATIGVILNGEEKSEFISKVMNPQQIRRIMKKYKNSESRIKN
ncbi:NAD(P)-binding domain-containing protein [Anaplasmataceae bacterium AB001_6]|nr:NAD(P)-binding domain-containing protein [Anaplasmataceae bacterium AB001_6]